MLKTHAKYKQKLTYATHQREPFLSALQKAGMWCGTVKSDEARMGTQTFSYSGTIS